MSRFDEVVKREVDNLVRVGMTNKEIDEIEMKKRWELFELYVEIKAAEEKSIKHDGEKVVENYRKGMSLNFVEEDGDKYHFYSGRNQYWVKKEYVTIKWKVPKFEGTFYNESLTFELDKVFVPKWYDLEKYGKYPASYKKSLEKEADYMVYITKRKEEIMKGARKIMFENKRRTEIEEDVPIDIDDEVMKVKMLSKRLNEGLKTNTSIGE